MKSNLCSAPVAFFVFNRPNHTAQVFDVIRSVRPEVLLLVADGPRHTTTGESMLCKEVLEIIGNVDWPCKVYKNYSKINLGCKKRLSTGLDWVFSLVDRAIILEDDCLPDSSFFDFCTEMLTKYQYEDKIMHISGFNRLSNSFKVDESYLFSRFGSIWGWATWRRAWKYYDVSMSAWEHLKKRKNYEILGKSKEEIEWRVNLFEKVYSGEINTWDYQWVFTRILNKGINIIPSVNLVSNIGFGEGSTHTNDINNKNANLKTGKITFPLLHTDSITVSDKYDQMYLIDAIPNNSNNSYNKTTIVNKVIMYMKAFFENMQFKQK